MSRQFGKMRSVASNPEMDLSRHCATAGSVPARGGTRRVPVAAHGSPLPTTQAVILSGGLGSRLRPVIGERPKGLAPVKGKPVLGYLLEKLDAQGIHAVLLAVGYRAQPLMDEIGHRWGNVHIRYSVEDEPLGTGGALRLAAPLLRDGPAFVLNGDTYIELDFHDFARACTASRATLGMALASVPDGSRYHVAECVDNRIRALAPGRTGAAFVNSGTYWFGAAALAALPARRRFSLENDFLIPYIGHNDVQAYFTTRAFIDIGTPEDYLRCQWDDRFG